MHKIILLFLFTLSIQNLLGQVEDDECLEVLDITTDYEMYPGNGKISICFSKDAKLKTLWITKPVSNPDFPDATSDLYDEKVPRVRLSLNTINTSLEPIAFMRPRRFGIEADAAWLTLYQRQPISAEKGGKLEVHILKNKLVNSKHILIFKLEKINNIWDIKIWDKTEKTWVVINSLHLSGSFMGIKTIEMN